MKKNIPQKNKIQIIVFVTVYIIVMLVLAGIMLEGAGTFVGEYLNMPVVGNYLKKNYGDIEYELVSKEYVKETRSKLGVDTLTRGYRYTYKTISCGNHGNLQNGDTFVIESYNFSITRDTIFTDYSRDTALIDKFSEYMLEVYKEKAVNMSSKFEPYALYVDIKVDVGEFESYEELINGDQIKYGDQVLHIKGDKLSFDDYKKTVAEFIQIFNNLDESKKELLKPSNLQIFYYYTNENDEAVMQYESELRRYELQYSEEQLISATDINYKVEATEDEQTKIKAYRIVKDVYIWVILGAVIILGSFWVYKRVKRLSRYVEDK